MREGILARANHRLEAGATTAAGAATVLVTALLLSVVSATAASAAAGPPAAKLGKAADETWQIVCGSYEGEDRVATADELGKALKRVPGFDAKLVRVVHEAEKSLVLYGSYNVFYDERGNIRYSAELRRDLDRIKQLAVGDQFPFLRALPRRVQDESFGPAEWDLRNSKCVYTLQIGVFFNTGGFTERKQAAVEWVRDLRKRGHTAWFLHDDAKGQSCVFVGCFDESAVVGDRSVLRDRTGGTLQAGGLVSDYSQDVIRLRQKEEFKYNLINMKVRERGGVAQTSFLVRVPRSFREGEQQP